MQIKWLEVVLQYHLEQLYPAAK